MVSLSGFWCHYQLRRLALDWPALWAERDSIVSEELAHRLDELLESGDQAVSQVVEILSDSSSQLSAGDLSRIRNQAGIAAVAVYGPDDRLQVWDGVHRGPVPEEVRAGLTRYAFGSRPLFSYLYFTAPAPVTGETVVAAALLQGSFPSSRFAESDDFAGRFRASSGEEILVSRPERLEGEGVQDFIWEGEPLLSVQIVRPTSAERMEAATLFWTGVAGFLAVFSWLLLALGGVGGRWHPVAASVSLLGVVVLLPIGTLLSAPDLFAPAHFLTPGPFELTLGRLLALVLAGGFFVGLIPAGRPRLKPLLGVGAPLVVLFPLVVWLFHGSVSTEYLAVGLGGWVVYQVTLALLLALVTLGAIRLGGHGGEEAGSAGWVSAAGLTALLFASGGTALVRETGTLSPWLAMLWAVPAYLGARYLRGDRQWGSDLISWTFAAVLGASVALPFAWGARVSSRMALGESHLEELSAPADPYLQLLLERLGESIAALDRETVDPVELLYGGWSGSGLASEGYPIWLTLWSPGGLPLEELRIGVTGSRPAVADDFLEEARLSDDIFVRRLSYARTRYLVLAPLGDGSVVSGVVPPGRPGVVGSPLDPLIRASSSSAGTPLTLVPFLPGDEPHSADGIVWTQEEDGWRGETVVRYSDGTVQAHYLVDQSGTTVTAARGTLLLLLDLLLFLTIWGVGSVTVLGKHPPLREWWSLGRSFRARITMGLFGFFLISIVIFGTLAFRILASAAVRTATALAERVVEDGAEWYSEAGGSMALLSERLGADLLEFRHGELRGGSVDELVELGLYEGWLPIHVSRQLEGRERLLASTLALVGEWEYVMAYRRLPDGDIMGSPVPIQAGEVALRRREVTDLLGFAVVLGAVLSLGLALLVGRTLSRPIETLQIASERVGKGNLEVKLPEDRADEFGAVFSAFNRMVLGIRRAQMALVRTTRRTQAILEEAATGVIALDSSGRVTLVNPRAEMLLGKGIPVGELLPESEGPAGELVLWVGRYFRDGMEEAGTDLQMGERRIRLRARRISQTGPASGAVLSLEDVTDELRSERILAWGEMARQVAHEVKNPLTPIKLSVQHLLRAWEDGRSDFGDILERNVEVVLREIDHLSEISRSFARFAAPQAAGQSPLEPVDVGAVVEEALALYRSGQGSVEYECRVPSSPEVCARTPELKEVLVNLLENSRAAVPPDGTIEIEVEVLVAEVEIRVRDNGTGIDPGFIPRIFEPHFCTRSTGTGLGLAIVWNLVESWGGSVEVESSVGEGTLVRIRLRIWGEEEGA